MPRLGHLDPARSAPARTDATCTDTARVFMKWARRGLLPREYKHKSLMGLPDLDAVDFFAMHPIILRCIESYERRMHNVLLVFLISTFFTRQVMCVLFFFFPEKLFM